MDQFPDSQPDLLFKYQGVGQHDSKFYYAGNGCGCCRTYHAERGRTQLPEDQHSVQEDIQAD